MRALGLIAAAAAVCALAGCGTTSEPAAAPAPVTVSETDLTDQEAQFLADLEAVDPDLVTKEDRALRRAENVCLDIEQGKNDEMIVDNTRQRYSNGTTVNLDMDQARRIVDSARANVC